jgi:hypothetical protein
MIVVLAAVATAVLEEVALYSEDQVFVKNRLIALYLVTLVLQIQSADIVEYKTL